MAFDLADVVPLTVTIRDADGAPADGGSVVLTIELPDGTAATPTVNHAGVGQYQVDYVPTMAGRHLARWVCTGLNASGYTDTFDVRPASPPYLVSLADAKKQLNMTTTTDDEELREIIEAATAAVERHLDKVVVRRTVVERRNLGNPATSSLPGVLQQIALAARPVISITSVVSADGATSWNPANMRVTDAGVVEVLSGSLVWGPVDWTLVAGMQVIPANYTKAAAIILQHLWDTQRGSQGGAHPAGLDTPGAGFTSFGYSIPNRALELLGPAISGIA